jgi:uncharacterized membrane protein
LNKHIDDMVKSSMAKTQVDSMEKMKEAVAKLTQARTSSVGLWTLMSLWAVVCAVLPALMQYWFITVALSALANFGFLFAIRPPGWRF